MGTLSECSRGVQFHKLVPKATVRLQTTAGAAIDQWVVATADQAFDFNAGKGVKSGMDVQAVQFTPAENGILSTVVHVGAHPTAADLNAGSFAKPLYECGECVWLFGLFPGADVHVLSHGVEELGKAVVRPDGQVEVALKRPLKIGDDITATQTACAAMGAPVSSTKPIAGGAPVPLDQLAMPQTVVQQPVKRCGTALYFDTIMNGASVTITRTPVGGTSSTIGPRCLSVSPFTLWGFAPFQGNEALVINTRLRGCNKAVCKDVKLTVDPGPPGPPTIKNTICTDTKEIVLGDLELDAVVEIAINTPVNPLTLHYGASAPQDTFPFPTSAAGATTLTAGATITVRQNLCGGANDWSTTHSTTILAAAAMPPKLQSPADHATGVSLTTFLHWADTGSAPCSQASEYNVRVGTTPAMNPADVVFAPTTKIISPSVGIPGSILKPGTTYFWQVRAHHAGSAAASSWSAVFQFTTVPGMKPPNNGPKQFQFCQTCPGFSQPKTITVTAPDFATAEAMASKGLPSTCFLSPGACP